MAPQAKTLCTSTSSVALSRYEVSMNNSPADLPLNFDGPFTLTAGDTSLFHSEFAASSGIYLWTIRQRADDTHLIHYIGQTGRTLAQRHREHLLCILGLDYGIFDPDKAQDGVSDVLWAGAWRDKTPDGPAKQIEAYRVMRDYVDPYLDGLSLFFAELNTDDQTRKHVEGCIGSHLRREHPEATSLYPDDCRVGPMRERYGAQLLIRSAETIRGLDSHIPY